MKIKIPTDTATGNQKTTVLSGFKWDRTCHVHSLFLPEDGGTELLFLQSSEFEAPYLKVLPAESSWAESHWKHGFLQGSYCS